MYVGRKVRKTEEQKYKSCIETEKPECVLTVFIVMKEPRENWDNRSIPAEIANYMKTHLCHLLLKTDTPDFLAS